MTFSPGALFCDMNPRRLTQWTHRSCFMTKQSWVNSHQREVQLTNLFIWVLFSLLLSTLLIFEIKTSAFTAVSSVCQWMIICLTLLSYVRISQVCHLVAGPKAQSIFIYPKWQLLKRDAFNLSERMVNVSTRITSIAVMCESEQSCHAMDVLVFNREKSSCYKT